MHAGTLLHLDQRAGQSWRAAAELLTSRTGEEEARILAIHGDSTPGVSAPRAGSDVARGTASTPSELFFFRPFLLRTAVGDGILPLFSCAAEGL